jgi:hypothetical protein
MTNKELLNVLYNMKQLLLILKEEADKDINLRYYTEIIENRINDLKDAVVNRDRT